MKALSLTALAAAAALAVTLPAPAEAQRHGDRWQRGFDQAQPHRRDGRPRAQHPRASEVPMRADRHRHPGLRPGHSARQYPRYHPRAGYRIGPPPRGHHYRMAGNTVVLVNDRTLQVVTVLGLLAALLG